MYKRQEQEVISRWRIEQCSELSAVSASFVLSTPTETEGAVFPGRIMLANTCTWKMCIRDRLQVGDLCDGGNPLA